MFDEWKEEIGDDEEKFAECARKNSECVTTAPRGGEIGFVTISRQLPPQIDDVVFRQQKKGEEQPGVYGHIATPYGLHLIYLHSCGEPKGKETYPEWMVKAGLAKNEDE